MVINGPIELQLHNCVSCCLDNTLNTPAWMDRQGSLQLCTNCVSSLTVGLLVGVEADVCFERSAVVLECDAASEWEQQVSDSWVFTSSNIQPIKFIPITTYSGIPLLCWFPQKSDLHLKPKCSHSSTGFTVKRQCGSTGIEWRFVGLSCSYAFMTSHSAVLFPVRLWWSHLQPCCELFNLMNTIFRGHAIIQSHAATNTPTPFSVVSASSYLHDRNSVQKILFRDKSRNGKRWIVRVIEGEGKWCFITSLSKWALGQPIPSFMGNPFSVCIDDWEYMAHDHVDMHKATPCRSMPDNWKKWVHYCT